MRATSTLAILGLLCLAACGGGGGTPVANVLYVDVQTGDDLNPGTAAAPFRSITHALQVARTGTARGTGDTIRVVPFTYTATSETFPIVVPSGVVLEPVGFTGIPEIWGGAAVPAQHGSGFTATIILEEHATFRGFEVRNVLTIADPGFHYAVFMVGDQAYMEGCFIVQARAGGVRVVSGNDILLHGNNIMNLTLGVGLHFAGGGVGGRVMFCNIHGNRIGVEYDAPGAVLNGATGDEGRVQIYNNSDTDVWIVPGVTVNARGCTWDNVPPQISTVDVGGGIDIFHINGGAGIDVTGFGPVLI